MSTGHNLDELQTRLRATEAAMQQETKVKLATDVAVRASNDAAIAKDGVARLDAKLDRVLEKLGELAVVRTADRWLHRIALLAVTAGGFGAFAWIAYQAWPK